MEEQSRFDTHGTLCTTPLLLNLMLSEYLRREAQDSAIQFDGAAALVCLRAHLPLSPGERGGVSPPTALPPIISQSPFTLARAN